MVAIGNSGLLAPGRLRWLRALAWMVALAAATIVLFNLVASGSLRLLGAAAGEASAGQRLAASVAGVFAIIGFYWAAVRTGERRSVSELGARRLVPELLLGCAIGAALIAAIVATLWLAGWVVVDRKPVDGVLLALRDSIRSGVVEELLLRLVIFRLLWRALGIWTALILSALLFGALHLGNPDSSLFAALALMCGEGIVIGLYLITGRIWASIGMHAAWNFTQGWVFGASVSGTSEIAGGPLTLRPTAGVPEILSGGGFGPEATLAALLISTAASLAMLTYAWKHGRFVAAD